MVNNVKDTDQRQVVEIDHIKEHLSEFDQREKTKHNSINKSAVFCYRNEKHWGK